MASNIDVIICDIISQEMGIDPDRVVVFNENWDAPKDEDIYVVVSKRLSKILSVKNYFDHVLLEEVQQVVSYTNYDIDISSINRDAEERAEEIYMALFSMYSIEKQELNHIKIFRNGDMIDLSFIETASGMKRKRIPIRVSNLVEKRKSADYFDKIKIQGEIDE